MNATREPNSALRLAATLQPGVLALLDVLVQIFAVMNSQLEREVVYSGHRAGVSSHSDVVIIISTSETLSCLCILIIVAGVHDSRSCCCLLAHLASLAPEWMQHLASHSGNREPPSLLHIPSELFSVLLQGRLRGSFGKRRSFEIALELDCTMSAAV